MFFPFLEKMVATVHSLLDTKSTSRIDDKEYMRNLTRKLQKLKINKTRDTVRGDNSTSNAQI